MLVLDVGVEFEKDSSVQAKLLTEVQSVFLHTVICEKQSKVS